MTNKPMQTMAVAFAVAVAGAVVAKADDAAGLRQDLAALERQNEALRQRVADLEQKNAVIAPTAPGADSFVAQAANAPVQALTGNGPLTWNGITLFGVIDAGIGWQSHGFPANPYMYAPPTLITRNSNHANFGVLPSGLTQSTIGLKGEHEILPGIAGVFNAVTGFVPTSGQLANAPMSLIQQNGLSRYNYSNNGDGSRGGQAFNDMLNVGLSSKTYGTLLFGRNRALTLDTVIAYDPGGAPYGFSLIGISGAAAGGGYTEDARWDNSLKYKVNFGPAHFGAMYKFADGTGGSNTGNANTPTLTFAPNNYAYQFNLGGEYQNLSLDAVVGHYAQAVSASPLSAVQLGGSSTFIADDNVVKATTGNANASTLAGVVTDNTNVMLAAKYTHDKFKFFLGYEHVLYANPQDSLGIGAQTQGGYLLSSVNNHALGSNKTVQYFWTGVKYAYDPKLELIGAYYHALQNAYTGAVAGSTRTVAGCGTTATSNCSGTLDAASAYGVYHFTKRFDVYAGVMWTSVTNGLASGFLYHVEWAPMAGVRYTF